MTRCWLPWLLWLLKGATASLGFHSTVRAFRLSFSIFVLAFLRGLVYTFKGIMSYTAVSG